ncbi:hypothetical protein NDU88_001213 [Pleurodeles waltl]|uniref:Uncharacterized protein n=1 Tax=Pleurodeles waltl TaxID=8319 RepID=A0AAV7Q2G3_PLEWA|nr:hypothetical protein NDU88_001213 [Pleurodeles waltl]
MFWSSTPYGIRGARERDYTCWFQVCLLGSGKVQFIDYKGDYLSMDPTDKRNAIKTVKEPKPPYSEFEVQYENEKVIFKASNGMFLRATWHYGEVHIVEAIQTSTDRHSGLIRIASDV